MEELASHIERAENVTIRQMENFRVMYNSQRSRWIMAKQKEQGEAAQVPKEFRRSFCLSDGRFTAERFCDVLCEDLIFLQKEFLLVFSSGYFSDICAMRTFWNPYEKFRIVFAAPAESTV